MNRHFKTGLMAIAIAVGLGACSESYPGMYYDYGNSIGNNEAGDSSSRVPVYVYVNRQSFFSVSSMRGVGPFDPLSDKDADGNPRELTPEDTLRYQKAVFHIYAFRDGKYVSTGSSYPAELASDPNMTWTIWENSSGQYDPNRMNCLLDGKDYSMGLPTQLDEKTGLYPSDKTTYYYGPYQDVGYNFFAYHIDDALTNTDLSSKPHRDRDSVWYELEIDGTQDIMCGYAPKLTEEVLNERYSELNITESERNRVLNIGNYSTYAAHRNIDPYVNVHHALSRLDFRAYPGRESANEVTIDSIYVTCPNSGKLIVAHRDPERVGFYVDPTKEDKLYLHEKPQIVRSEDGTEVLDILPCELIEAGKYEVEWKKEYEGTTVTQREYVEVGGNIILPSQQEYIISIVASQKRKEGQDPDMKMPTVVSTYRVSAPVREENKDADGNYWFMPGRYYTINVVIYGLQEIKVIANIDGWQYGGSIDVDPDDAENEHIY